MEQGHQEEKFELPTQEELGELFEKSVKFFGAVAVGTSGATNSQTGKVDVLGYIMLVHEQLAMPVSIMLSKELVGVVAKALLMIEPDVTCELQLDGDFLDREHFSVN